MDVDQLSHHNLTAILTCPVSLPNQIANRGAAHLAIQRVHRVGSAGLQSLIERALKRVHLSSGQCPPYL